MKHIKYALILFAPISLILFLSFKPGNTHNDSDGFKSDTSSNYSDGNYEGYSQSVYTSEPYWGFVQISVVNGAFTDIKFIIRDTVYHENVDSIYGVNHFSGNPAYMQQCVDDGHGIENYPKKLIETQNLDNVDAVSGATWSYNIFKASVKEALQQDGQTSVNTSSNNENVTLKVYPNPSNSSITFEYSLNQSGNIKVGFYDINGKLLRQLVNQRQIAGSYRISYNDIIAYGVYYCQLQVDNTITCKKIVCL
jgi:major membrane immunogen (membrane-anchored lipoprotein)